MTDFELLKDITQKVEGENLREMIVNVNEKVSQSLTKF